MKQRVTVSLSEEVLDYVKLRACGRGSSRSQVIERMIRESQRRRRLQELARQAQGFFCQPESEEELRERQDWLRASQETQKVDR